MSDPVVSIVVNSFQTERYIATCLESVLALRGPWPFEVIVIDDCSTDRSSEIAEQFAARDERVRVLRNPVNVNAAASVNRAFAVARGRYIARLDSDDVYRADFLEKTIPVFESNPGVGLVYGDIAMMDQDGVPSRDANHLAARRLGRPAICRELETLMIENIIPAPATIARREAWDAVLPVPAGRNFLDWYCTLNMARRWDFAFVDAILADYRIHPGNMHKAMTREKYGEQITWLNLNEIFACEDFGGRRSEVKGRVFARNYLVLADKYFGFGMNADARRCYLGALRHQPRLALEQPRMLRLLAASMIPRAWYEGVKRALRTS